MAKQQEKAVSATEQLIIKTISQLQDNISKRINQVEQHLNSPAEDEDFHQNTPEQELELLELESRILGEIRDDASHVPANRIHPGIRSVIELCLQTELDKPAVQTDRQILSIAAEQLDEQAALLLEDLTDSAQGDTAIKAKADLFNQLAENVRLHMPERRSETRKATSGALFDEQEVLKLA